MFHKIKKLSLLICIFVIATVAALLLAEYFTRRINPQDTYDFVRSRSLHIHEKGDNIPITLMKNVDNFEFVGQTVEFSTKVSTNSFGFRGKQTTKVKPKDTYRILFLGDSMTFGWGVNNEETFPAIVEKKLNEAKNKELNYEVLNAAFTAGKSLDTYYVFLQNSALDFKPDIVIINIFPFNDYTDISEVNWDEIDKNGLPAKISSKNQEIKSGHIEATKNKNWKYQLPILKNSHAALLLMDFMEKKTPGVVNIIKKNIASEEKIAEIYDPYEGSVQYCLSMMQEQNCPPGFYKNITAVENLLTATKDLLETENIKLLVTIIPWPEQIKVVQSAGAPAVAYNPNKKIRNFLDEHKIEYIDLLPRFTAGDANESFYKVDAHFNKRGNEIVAEELFNFIDLNILKK